MILLWASYFCASQTFLAKENVARLWHGMVTAKKKTPKKLQIFAIAHIQIYHNQSTYPSTLLGSSHQDLQESDIMIYNEWNSTTFRFHSPLQLRPTPNSPFKVPLSGASFRKKQLLQFCLGRSSRSQHTKGTTLGNTSQAETKTNLQKIGF